MVSPLCIAVPGANDLQHAYVIRGRKEFREACCEEKTLSGKWRMTCPIM